MCGLRGPGFIITEPLFDVESDGPGVAGNGLSGLPTRSGLPLGDLAGTGDDSLNRSGVFRPSRSRLFFRLWPMNVPKLVLLPWLRSSDDGGLSPADDVLRCERPVVSPEISSGRPPIGPVGVVSSDDIGKRGIFCCLSISNSAYE